MERLEYINYWLTNLVSNDTIKNNNFTEWMWCPERYSVKELEYMEVLFKCRKRRIEKMEEFLYGNTRY